MKSIKQHKLINHDAKFDSVNILEEIMRRNKGEHGENNVVHNKQTTIAKVAG